jgi:hypothetical protein
MSQVVDEALLSARSEEENNERKAERALLRWPPIPRHASPMHPSNGPSGVQGATASDPKQHSPSGAAHPHSTLNSVAYHDRIGDVAPRFTFDVIARPLHVWRRRAAPEPAACLRLRQAATGQAATGCRPRAAINACLALQ